MTAVLLIFNMVFRRGIFQTEKNTAHVRKAGNRLTESSRFYRIGKPGHCAVVGPDPAEKMGVVHGIPYGNLSSAKKLILRQLQGQTNFQ